MPRATIMTIMTVMTVTTSALSVRHVSICQPHDSVLRPSISPNPPTRFLLSARCLRLSGGGGDDLTYDMEFPLYMYTAAA